MSRHATSEARELLRYGNDLDGVVRVLWFTDVDALVAERTGGESLLLAELDQGEGVREAIAIALQFKAAPLPCRRYVQREREVPLLEPMMAAL